MDFIFLDPIEALTINRGLLYKICKKLNINWVSNYYETQHISEIKVKRLAYLSKKYKLKIILTGKSSEDYMKRYDLKTPIQKELYDALSKNRVYVHYSIYNIKGSKSIFDDITQYLNSCKITPTVGKAIVLSNGKTTKFGENLISVKHGLSLPVFLKCCAIMRKVVY